MGGLRGDSSCSGGGRHLEEKTTGSQNIGDRTTLVETEMEVDAMLGTFTVLRGRVFGRVSGRCHSCGSQEVDAETELGAEILKRDQHMERKGEEAGNEQKEKSH